MDRIMNSIITREKIQRMGSSLARARVPVRPGAMIIRFAGLFFLLLQVIARVNTVGLGLFYLNGLSFYHLHWHTVIDIAEFKNGVKKSSTLISRPISTFFLVFGLNLIWLSMVELGK